MAAAKLIHRPLPARLTTSRTEVRKRIGHGNCYPGMELVTHEDYLAFRGQEGEVTIGGVTIRLAGPYRPLSLEPPDFRPESTTVWSFPERGEWATHAGDFPGNWSPYIPRNLILRYTQPGDTILDPMMGSGTTLIECRLLGRRGIGVDINPAAVMVARDRLFFHYERPSHWPPECPVTTYVGDCRNLDKIEDDSVDLVATHPPYGGIISYSRLPGDLSALPLDDFLPEMRVVARELFRVVRPGGHCAILVGDTRRHLHYVPIAYHVMEAFLAAGFLLREEIIKLQWNMKATRQRWRRRLYPFYKIAHEQLFVFRKPQRGEKTSRLRHSARRGAMRRRRHKGPPVMLSVEMAHA
jgi:SAM-dependent methyltransferase